MGKFLFPIFLIAFSATAAQKTSKKAKYQLTEHEKKVVEEAKKEFEKSKGAPPPSKHMLDKMQSGFGD